MAAFGKDSGYTNLNNGVFSSVIYSKQAQIAFRKASVAQAITNSEYFGEIANQGDTVRILKEPDITVNALLRGTTISTQDLVDNDFQLTIDKANYFAFKLDDIEEQQAHHDFMSLASDRAAYKIGRRYGRRLVVLHVWLHNSRCSDYYYEWYSSSIFRNQLRRRNSCGTHYGRY